MQDDQLIDFKITLGAYDEFIAHILDTSHFGKSAYICVANVHMFIEAQKDKGFREVVKEADIVTPDGKPLCWALRLLNGVNQERVAGMDLFPALIKAASRENKRVYFYGGTGEMMEKLTDLLKTEFPSLTTSGTYSPPFRQLTAEETTEVVYHINSCSPDLVFVALGCPKQEKWMHAMKGQINATMIGVGGALPVYAGLQTRAPQWMQNNGLEWLYRLLQEPRRLFKRYATTNSRFILIVFKVFLKKLVSGGQLR